jgi:hypothetical protein
MTAGNTVVVFAAFYNTTTADCANQTPSTYTGHVNAISDTAGSNAYTQLAWFCQNTTRIEVWGTLSIASTNTSGVITVTSASGTGSAPALIFDQYSGVVAFGTTQTAGANASTTATVSLTTQDNNDFVVAVFAGHASNAFTFTVGTHRGSSAQNSVASVRGDSGDNTNATPASVTNTATMTSADWAAIAVKLRTSAATNPAQFPRVI